MAMAREWVCHDCRLLCQILSSHFYLVLSPIFWLIATCWELSYCFLERWLGQRLSFTYVHTESLAQWHSGPKRRPLRCYCNINNSNNALTFLGPYRTFSRHEFSFQTSCRLLSLSHYPSILHHLLQYLVHCKAETPEAERDEGIPISQHLAQPENSVSKLALSTGLYVQLAGRAYELACSALLLNSCHALHRALLCPRPGSTGRQSFWWLRALHPG